MRKPLSEMTLAEQLQESVDRLKPVAQVTFAQQLAAAAGADIDGMRPAVEALAAHLDTIAVNDRNRPLWFAAVCLAVARTLREGMQ